MASSTNVSSLQALKSTLGLHIAHAAKARKDLETCTTEAKAAATAALESIRRARTNSESLADLHEGLRALTKRAETDHTTTPSRLKSALADYVRKIKATEETHDKCVDDAWQVWQEAVLSTLKAGNAQKEHHDVLSHVGELGGQEKSDEHGKCVEGIKSVLQKHNEDMQLQLISDAQLAQDMLKTVPQILANLGMAWGKGSADLSMAAAAAEAAIEEAEQRFWG